ncbi:MAG: very short patch repair endonuclease [Planctomycetota bacterium]
MDNLSGQQRSEVMSRIKGKDTKPELVIRKALHTLGYRYRLHRRDLPGTPDIVFPKYKTAVFVNGCFWHFHECELFQMPKTRTEWWRKKLEGNRRRDRKNLQVLMEKNWRVCIIWECFFRGKRKDRARRLEEAALRVRDFLSGHRSYLALCG